MDTLNISANALNDLASTSGGETYFGYSGRGMFGAECVGITLPSMTDFITLGCALQVMYDNGEIDGTLFGELTNHASTDNMGRSIIIYWSGVSCDDAPSDDDEDEEA
jgi:hypothetical protein